jgi:hypothetical protein
LRTSKADADKSLQTQLGREVLGVCAESLRKFGADISGALTVVRPLAAASCARQLLADAGPAARINTRWLRTPDYLDASGRPNIIAVRGKAPSFQALCSDLGLAPRWKQLFEFSCQFGLSERRGTNRVAYVSDVVLLTGNPTLVLARAAVTIERYMRTCIHNANSQRNVGESLGDITTQVKLSRAEFLRLSRATRRSMASFIESTDRHLLTAIARDGAKRRSPTTYRWSGVTAFAFRD